MGKPAARAPIDESAIVESEEERVWRRALSRHGCACELTHLGRRFIVLTDRRGLVHAQEILACGKLGEPLSENEFDALHEAFPWDCWRRGGAACVISTASPKARRRSANSRARCAATSATCGRGGLASRRGAGRRSISTASSPSRRPVPEARRLSPMLTDQPLKHRFATVVSASRTRLRASGEL